MYVSKSKQRKPSNNHNHLDTNMHTSPDTTSTSTSTSTSSTSTVKRKKSPSSNGTSTLHSSISNEPSTSTSTSHDTTSSTSTPTPGIIGSRGSGLSIKVISRDEQAYTRQRKTDIHKVFHNVDPKLHPFERAREYTRALQATKLSKLFAKPFLGALDGHADAVHCMTTSPVNLSTFFSGAADGDIRAWNLTTRECQWSVRAHSGFVRGLCMDAFGQHVYSCSTDQTIKVWSAKQDDVRRGDIVRPIHTILGKSSFSGIDHHRRDDIFVTSSTQVDVWDETRTEPIHSFTWGCDSVLHVKLNPVEVNVLVSTASDRNIVLYDIRTKTPIRKMIMRMMTNAITWNPMEAFNFTTANEDHNAYTFDMRHLDHALNIHQDHVSAVMSVDYAPTGRELVTGSYDRTIRIFGVDDGHSREIYHTKRMQRLFCVKYSADNKYILSGSDDTNLRLWKARAAEKLETISSREQNKKNYLNKLTERYQYAPEIRRIYKHRHVPRAISVATHKKHKAKGFAAVKLQRVRAHSKPGAVPFTDAKKAAIVTHVK